MPLFAIRLDSLITKYMGETAAKLRLIFDALVEIRGVYLFDEVDALADGHRIAQDLGISKSRASRLHAQGIAALSRGSSASSFAKAATWGSRASERSWNVGSRRGRSSREAYEV